MFFKSVCNVVSPKYLTIQTFNGASVIETECLGSMTKIQRCFSHETSGYCRKYTLWEMKVYDIFTTTYLLAKGFPGTHISLAWDTGLI